MSSPYLFTSSRLGFRPWQPSDIDALYALCSNPGVMRYFPKVLSLAETKAFLQRLIDAQEIVGYSYYAVEQLEDGCVIGFVGLALQTYEAEFTPATDIGWRLLPEYWGRGLATEGARACLEQARRLGLTEIVAIAVTANAPSLAVMRRIGMIYRGTFVHPGMPADSPLQPCAWYSLQL